jgi:hypothetical protein
LNVDSKRIKSTNESSEAMLERTLREDFEGIVLMPHAESIFFNRKYFKKIKFKIIDNPKHSIPVVLYFTKNYSFLIDLFNEKINTFQSAGLLNYWTQNETADELKLIHEKNNDLIVEPSKLTLKHLRILFHLLSIGAFVSFITFIVEIMYHKMTNKKI